MSVTDVITAAGAMLTGIGLIYTAIQVQAARKIARGQFLLQLDQMIEQHNEVHGRLTGLGWPDGRTGPESIDEWIKVGRALGLFEHIQILVKDGIIDIDTVDELYSHRLFHLVNNEIIKKRYFSDNRRWNGVIELWSALENKKTFKLMGSIALESESQPESKHQN